MHRPVSWFERNEDGIKREIEVMVAQKKVVWKMRLSTDEKWDCQAKPSEDDWNVLLQKVKDRYQRHNVSYKDVELVTRLHHEALHLAKPNADGTHVTS